MATPTRTVHATIDVCAERPPHAPHLRLSTPWRDSDLVQHPLWCLGSYDQARQGNHVSVQLTDDDRGTVTNERPCGYGCTDPAHPARRGYLSAGR